ncbi:ATP-dependent nuclease [Nocardioides litoris]|uniref:ATP-dependent nuclease n=1 Tax=Nocardioides litoris TaxID=1926648 RepID=UPI00112415AF|nr:AAA family ATPase [Nocardioides litoris]
MAISIDAFTAQDGALQGGNPERVRLSIRTLEVQNTPVELPSPGVTAFVGGNNVGKSTLLRQMVDWIGSERNSPTPSPDLIRGVELERGGSQADLASWLYHHRAAANQGQFVGILNPSAGFLAVGNAAHYWSFDGYSDRLAGLGPALVHYADTQSRLEMSQPSPRRADFTDPAITPLQRLEDDPALLGELSRISFDAFQQGLVLDPLSGQLILRVGDPGVDAPSVDAITAQYREALGRLGPLHEQGDGMRSMIGLLLPIIASTYPVVVVDEPEAFLHPPQARVLGRELARLANDRGIQVILATHDKNILMGLLDSPGAAVSVVRLTRQEDRTTAAQLPAGRLSAVWSEPSLRYSNILDGLFYRAVVLAENERDCRFFAAALDADHRVHTSAMAPHDVLFVPTAGKTNIRSLALTTRACGVPTVACADLDLLNDEGTLRSVVESVGGDWSSLADDYRLATQQFRGPKRRRLNRDVAASVAAILAEAPDRAYDGGIRSRVTEELALESPWRAVKDHGMSAFRAERARADQLIEAMDHMGVVLVKQGELEGLAPSLGVRKGSGWVPAAIDAGAHEQEPTREHVRRLVSAALTLEAAIIHNVDSRAHNRS